MKRKSDNDPVKEISNNFASIIKKRCEELLPIVAEKGITNDALKILEVGYCLGAVDTLAMGNDSKTVKFKDLNLHINNLLEYLSEGDNQDDD